MHRLVLILIITLVVACGKKVAEPSPSQEGIKGTWILKGTDGSGPGNTLTFATKNNKDLLSFDCSGSPGPDWPSYAETEYRFENNKLSYKLYYDPNAGFFDVTSFMWIDQGKEFEVKRRHILLFMSADYTVRYVRK